MSYALEANVCTPPLLPTGWNADVIPGAEAAILRS